jgi:DNA-binding XRE family transcriptional regulator
MISVTDASCLVLTRSTTHPASRDRFRDTIMVKQGLTSAPGDISPQLLNQYCAERVTLRQLAGIQGVSVTTIWRRLRRRGISRGSRRGRPTDNEKRATVLKRATQGRSRRQIADELGVTPEWVRSMLAEKGLAVSLQILTCRRCGTAIASGHKAEQRPRVLCLACLRRQPALPFAERLKAFRLAHNLSRAQLSVLCSLSRALIGNYERGEGQPTLPSARRLAAALHISLSTLLGHKARRAAGR